VGSLAFFIGLVLEIALTAASCIVVGTLVLSAFVVVAPLAIAAETLLFVSDLFRPSPPPPS